MSGSAVTAVMPSMAHAHITIAPTQSMAGATEKYTLRVPSEGKVATVAAELEVPEGVIVEAVAVPNGWKHEIKRQGPHRGDHLDNEHSPRRVRRIYIRGAESTRQDGTLLDAPPAVC